MSIDDVSAISRRDLLAGAAAGLVAGAALQPSAGHAASPITPAGAGAIDAVQTHRKLKYRTDAGLVFWWLRGVKYGQVGTTLTPLFTNHTGTIQRIEPTDDGGFDLSYLEVTIATVVDNDTPLKAWKNPYTGEVLPVKVRPMGPTTVHYRADNSRVIPETIGGSPIEATSEVTGPYVVGDDVFISEVIQARVYRSGPENPFVVNDMSHYHGSLAELSSPATTMAAATVSFGEITGWQKWMNMGDRPGNLTSRTFGKKAASYSQMPEAWLKGVALAEPELAEELARDPLAALNRQQATFDR